MVSYEVSIGFVIVTVLLYVGSLNLGDIINAQSGSALNWFAFSPLFPMFIIFFVSALAETNRLPFDLPEAEGELVAGYNVEYSSMSFALFFLGEYANMILMSGMTVILFLGGWQAPVEALAFVPGVIWFALKTALILFVFLWVRATFPRYRYDQLMRLGWKVFLPFSLIWVVAISGYLVFAHKLPSRSECLSSEGVYHLSWQGRPYEGRLVSWKYEALGYDVQPSCPDTLYQQIDKSE
jgi:NADH:ubiquinone oxidoreductase subunit 1 (chain H)